MNSCAHLPLSRENVRAGARALAPRQQEDDLRWLHLVVGSQIALLPDSRPLGREDANISLAYPSVLN